MYWWWDIYIAANNLWTHYKGLSGFMSGVDLTQYRPISSLEIASYTGASGQAIGLGLRGKDTLVWVRSKDYTVDASIAVQEKQQNTLAYEPPLVEAQTLIIDDIPDGRYTVFWYDPQTAGWLPKTEVIAVRNSIAIPIPSFRGDIAAKIVRTP